MNCARALLDPHYQKTNASSFLSNRVSKLPDNPVKRFDTNDVSLAIGFTKLLVRNNKKKQQQPHPRGKPVCRHSKRERERKRSHSCYYTFPPFKNGAQAPLCQFFFPIGDESTKNKNKKYSDMLKAKRVEE